MKNTNGHDVRLSSLRCSSCEDLRQLKARVDVAFRHERNLYRVGVKAIDPAALSNLEEELTQTSAARKFIYYAIHAHLTDQHSRARRERLAA